MGNAVLYVHGKGGNAEEAERYRTLFPACEVVGLDYRGTVPWEAGPEIRAAAEALRARADSVVLIANSIGAYFSLHAGLDGLVQRAYFISPILDMERLIGDMMTWAGVREAELRVKRVIPTTFGEDLSLDYLCWVRSHPVRWTIPTEILYGSCDTLTSPETVRAFAAAHGAGLTVLDGGEHWFHTEEQLRFLDNWITEKEKET